MSTNESPKPSVPTMSRRLFLDQSVRIAAGTAATPALAFVGGCGQQKQTPSVSRSGEIVLRAGRFSGTPDGQSREIWGYNGQLPGPVVRAKEGERLRIRVINDLAEPTTVHWHGMHQIGTWQMDGVDGVSRPPIAPGSEFVYEFRAEPAGTHWYHSHTGVQYGNGLFGPLIIEERAPIASYDREEILLMNDWFHQLGDALLAKIVTGMSMDKMPGKMDMKNIKDIADIPFQSGLINGKGRATPDSMSPLTLVEAKKGETVRLRLINGSSTYALRFQIDGHPLTVIATDGSPMKPVVVDNLILCVGESYDVLLKADQEGVYWIRAVTLDGKETRAILRYTGNSVSEPEETPVSWGPRLLAPVEMRSREPVNLPDPTREIPILLGGSMMPYRWSMNDQYFPKADPIALQKDETIRFVFQNATPMDHPFHLHGHSFYVLGKPESVNAKDPILKDTVNVPAKTDLVIQWRASNPGRWFFHCHIEWHLETGMARVVEIKPFQT